ncbi:MAG: hypothetical protein Hals2KO_40980 [Halioglobus sp.]
MFDFLGCHRTEFFILNAKLIAEITRKVIPRRNEQYIGGWVLSEKRGNLIIR